MSWHLRGSYVETCSCELMCPCNLSLDHGATYDFCRVTLVFNIREGAVDATDIAGCKVAIDRRHPEGHDRGQLAGRRVRGRARPATPSSTRSSGCSAASSAARWPVSRRSSVSMLGVERAAIEINDDGLRHSVRVGDGIDFEIQDIVPFGVRDR